MPELPEVETVRLGLQPVLEGRVLAKVTALRPDLRIPLPQGFAKRLTGRRVVKLTRRGRRKVEARKAVWQRRWQESMEGLDDEELRVAARVLERIGTIFCEQQREG